MAPVVSASPQKLMHRRMASIKQVVVWTQNIAMAKASSEKDKVKVKETATKEGNSQKEKGGKGVDGPKDINTKDAVAVDGQLKEDEVPEEDKSSPHISQIACQITNRFNN